MSILLLHFITPFWVAVRGKAKLKILELVSPYSEKPKVRQVTPFLPILGLLSGVKPHLKCIGHSIFGEHKLDAKQHE